MNKFERTSDHHKNLGIGQVNNPLTIIKAQYLLSNTEELKTYGELHPHNIQTFLNFLERDPQNKDLKKSGWTVGKTLIFETIDERSGEHRSKVPLTFLLGKCVRIEFEERIYRIPSQIKV